MILSMPVYSIYLLNKKKMNNETVESSEEQDKQEESNFYKVQNIGTPLHNMDFIEIPEGKIYLVATEGNGTGKRPVFVGDPVKNNELPKIKEGLSKLIEDLQAEYRAKNPLEKVEEEYHGEPISYISLEARAILNELAPELIKFISDKLKASEEYMKSKNEDIVIENPPKTPPKKTKTTKK